MQPIATDVPVCHAASLVFGVQMQKQLNGLRSCLGWRLLGAHATLLDGAPDLPRQGLFFCLLDVTDLSE